MAKAVIIDYTYLGGEELFTPERQACAESGIDLELRSCKTEDEIIEAAHDADAVLCCGNPPITRKVIEALPQCRAYIRYGIGVNSVDLDAATEHGKLVYFMPGFCAEELVLHATALVLNLLRNVCFYDREIRAGKWPKAKGALPRRLTNMTVGLYGFGASARPMAKVFGHGFGSRVIACDPYLPDSVFEEAGVARVSFDELLAQADIVSIHAPLTAENRHIFNMDAFRKMKNTAAARRSAAGAGERRGDAALGVLRRGIPAHPARDRRPADGEHAEGSRNRTVEPGQQEGSGEAVIRSAGEAERLREEDTV